MPLHNYICPDAHVEQDVFFRGDPPRQRVCPTCGQPSQIHFGAFGAFDAWMSTQGYQKGIPDPQTGIDYDNYAHKKRVLRQQGLEEDRLYRRDEIEAQVWERERDEKAARAQVRTGDVLRADTLGEVMDQIGQQTEARPSQEQIRRWEAEVTEEDGGAWGGL